MEETIKMNKRAIEDLIRVKSEFDGIVESMELMSDQEFMVSFRKAREQIKGREFDNWNEL